MELRIEGLSKRYANGVQALKDVSLSIGPGMFGLLGPNGAGKSTLMRTIATLQEADAGTVKLGDLDVLLAVVGRNVIGILCSLIMGYVPDLCSAMAAIRQSEVLLVREPPALVKKVDGRVHERVVQKALVAELEGERRLASRRLCGGR